MRNTGEKNYILTLCLMILFLSGSVIFLVGFFPVSYVKFEVDGGINSDSRPTSLDGVKLNVPQRQYAQTILMIVDALRYDFPTATRMPFAHNSSCAIMHLRTSIPTVTLPRIKSLTTGTISTFLDIVLNLGRIEQLQDSILHRMKKRGDIVSFVGDSTWASLFPSELTRTKANIDSFFVNDFTEGDLNVTRVLTEELMRTDWSLLILHYLGLDHIGHVEGTVSLKIPQKLAQMDAVVQQIYASKKYKNQLVLLTGDHGMRDGGGHGGSTYEELYVPLLFFKEHCTRSRSTDPAEYNQIDLAPTLAILSSLEIPTMSVGCLIPELLDGLSLEDQLYAYHYNTLHLIEKAKKEYSPIAVQKSLYFSWFVEAQASHKKFLREKRSGRTASTFSTENAKLMYMRASRKISALLSDSIMYFHYDLIGIGLTLTTLTTIYAILSVLYEDYDVRVHAFASRCSLLSIIFVAAIINFWGYYAAFIAANSITQACLLTLPIAASVYIAAAIIRLLLGVARSAHISCSYPKLLLAGFVFQSISLGSSSYVEEEHQMWYYLGISILTLFCAMSFRAYWRSAHKILEGVEGIMHAAWSNRFSLIMVASLGLLRRLNQSGDKWRNYPDIGDVLNKKEHKALLSASFFCGLLLLAIQLRKFNNRLQMISSVLSLICVIFFRGHSGTISFFPAEFFKATPALALFWLSVCFTAVAGFVPLITRAGLRMGSRLDPVKFLNATFSCLLLIEALLSKPHNMILIPAIVFTLEETYKLNDRLHPTTGQRASPFYVFMTKCLLTVFVTKMFYFFQGNTNSLATIDLNPGYIGQSTYNPLIVVALVTLNTYCSHFCAFMCLLRHVLKEGAGRPAEPFKDLSPQRPHKYLQQVVSIYAVLIMWPAALFFGLLLVFRYHLFIYSVFAPKALYEGFTVLLYAFIFLVTILFSKIVE